MIDFFRRHFELSAYHIPTIAVMLYLMLRPVLAGAPYVPTRRKHVRAMLDMAQLTDEDAVYELGCGDGYFSVAAARLGVRQVIGYDVLGPMIRFANWRARRAGVADRCSFHAGDIRELDLSGASFVYTYLMTDIMDHLASRALLTLKPGARILSSTFSIDTDRHRDFELMEQRRFGATNVYLYRRR